jgi:predicted nucleic acid-binding protein
LLRRRELVSNLVVLTELLVGSRSDADYARNERQIGQLPSLPITTGTWRDTGRLGYELRRKGISVRLPDLLIAASALEHGATLMHADPDFDRIAAQTDLKVESYVGTV